MIIFVIIGVILGAGAVVFALQNTLLIKVVFLTWQSADVSLALVLMVAILCGMIISLLVSIPEMVGNYLKFKAVQKEKEALQSQVASYKAIVSQFDKKNTEKTIDSVDVDGNKISFLQ